ncbi:hypothetical protein AMECASPLE_017382 [Ameca splendens]|uniref:Uncharacterized protein n=1 Tax=Ameca splendens TaxID=208324 RepID=A0ABV0ZP42_9TELE
MIATSFCGSRPRPGAGLPLSEYSTGVAGGAVCLSPPWKEGDPLLGSGAGKVCMASVNECITSIVVCLYVGCVSVFMCAHECGNVFVSGWVLGCSFSWISLGPLSNVGPISSLPHSGRWSIGGSRCLGLWCVPAHSRWLFAGA